MKNLWFRLKVFCLKLWHGISDQELERAMMKECIDRMQADALLYGIGISRVEPKDFYGTGVAELTLAELRDQAVNSPYHAMRSAELWQDYIARQLPKDKKRARKHKKIGRKKRNIRPK